MSTLFGQIVLLELTNPLSMLVVALKDQLRLGGEATDEYRKAADRLELTLRELTAAGQQVQETLQQKNAQLQTGAWLTVV